MSWNDKRVEVGELLGKTLTACYRNFDDDKITFEIGDEKYEMYHNQDCCEYVIIEDIVGDLQDLVGEPLLEAEEVECDDGPLNQYDDSYTWTFYKFGTIKGHVNIRWYGSSNGYYSESVDIYLVNGRKAVN